MPGLDGIQTAQKIREICISRGVRQPHISCASAYNEPSFVAKALSSGMDSYVYKPI